MRVRGDDGDGDEAGALAGEDDLDELEARGAENKYGVALQEIGKEAGGDGVDGGVELGVR